MFDAPNKIWNLKVGGRPSKPEGFSKAPYGSFLLGESQWTISNDGKIEETFSISFCLLLKDII